MSHRSHRSHRLFLPDDSHFDDCFVRICLDSQDLCELKKSGSHRSHRLFLPDASHFDDCFVRICLDSQDLCELKKICVRCSSNLVNAHHILSTAFPNVVSLYSESKTTRHDGTYASSRPSARVIKIIRTTQRDNSLPPIRMIRTTR
jgi:hypothetical protein